MCYCVTCSQRWSHVQMKWASHWCLPRELTRHSRRVAPYHCGICCDRQSSTGLEDKSKSKEVKNRYFRRWTFASCGFKARVRETTVMCFQTPHFLNVFSTCNTQKVFVWPRLALWDHHNMPRERITMLWMKLLQGELEALKLMWMHIRMYMSLWAELYRIA